MEKSIDIRQKKIILLKMLEHIHNICEKNNLYYFLVGGTLIGSVRNSGFIPWDDDVDIMMPRSDYNKLIKIINDQYKNLYAYTYKTAYDYPFAYSKISYKPTVVCMKDTYKIRGLGINVDLFPYDGISNSKILVDFQYDTIHNLQRLRDALRHTKNENKMLPFVKSIFIKNIVSMITHLASINSVDKCSKVGCVVAVKGGKKEIVDKKIFSSRHLVKFENIELYIPDGYDTYLKNIYGDYMKLPPKSQRKPEHQLKTYWKK